MVIYSRTKFLYKDVLTWSDVLDFFAPYFVMPFYLYFYYKCREQEIIALILRTNKERKTLLVLEILVYFLLVVAWIQGHGMHLSANSVHNVIDREYFSYTNPDAAHHRSVLVNLEHVVDFWDEKLGHEAWHAGIYGLQAILVWRGCGSNIYSFSDVLRIFASAVVYGFILFCAIIEGGTPHIGIPYIIFTLTVFASKHSFTKIRRCGLLLYFFVGTTLAAVLCSWWGWFTNWTFVEFSEMGLLFTKQ